MRIDDDSFLKQVQLPQPPPSKESVPSWRTLTLTGVSEPKSQNSTTSPLPKAPSSSHSHSHHKFAGKILLALTALIIITLIVSSTILIVGESRGRGGLSSSSDGGKPSLGVTELNVISALRTKRQPPYAPGGARPPDDDEINDAEIYKAVVQSMAEWSKLAKKKSEQKQQKERERLQLQAALEGAALAGVNNTDLTAILSRQKRDEEIVCYGELGCFRDEGPFDYLDMLPSPPEEVSTKFLLYTRKNLHTPQIYSYFNFTTMLSSPPGAVPPPPPPPPPPAMSPPAPTAVATAKSLHGPAPAPHPSHSHQPCNFNGSHPTKIIIHGFGSTCNQMWASEIRLSILAMTETNVICVDWENGAALPNYVRAAVNTRLVGKQVAMLIFWLNKHFGSDTKDFHLIGFSLGAHVAGFAGQDLKNLSRITGLDPAGPLFESYDPKVRLDSSDALFVDVIHSNGDSLLMGGLGSWEPMGHVDFYPNGGRVQKGCSNLFLGAVRDFLWAASDGDGRSLCNHRRAYKFFTESVSPKCSFPAFTCDSYDKFLTGACFSWDANRCGNMGYYADQMPVQSKGILYLLTREDEPFCANQYRITVESSPSPVPITTYGGLEAVIIGADYVNETFLITQTVKDSMVAGSVLQKLVVAHPAITEPIQIQLKYTAYQGWLYSGIARWSMDSLIITNAYGKSMSFCTRLLLPNGIPVTIRLTPGICINRYTEPTAGGVTPPSGSNAIGTGAGRPPPQFPMQHGYEQYPSAVTGTEGNVNSITENSTSVHAHNAAAIAADLELSLMKPPRVVMTSGQHPQHSQYGVMNGGGHSEEVIGPTYHLTSGPAADWSQWHPVEPPATWAAKHAPNQTRYGTPVVFSPASSEDESRTEQTTTTTEEGTTEVTTIDAPEAVPNSTDEAQISTSVEENITEGENKLNLTTPQPITVKVNETLTEITKTSSTNDTRAINNTMSLGTQESEQPKPTDLSLTESIELPVSIQICHFVNDGSSSTESSPTNTDGSQRMACVYPQEKPVPSATEADNTDLNVMSNNALGQIHSFQHIVDTELGVKSHNDSEVSGNQTSEIPKISATTETEKISVLKQELHAPGKSSHNNNDPEAMPPHLHYILQQLENEGLGPPGGSMVPGHVMNGNSIGSGHGARSLGAIGAPNYHDNHIQTDFISGRQVPLLFNPNFHFGMGPAHAPFFAPPHESPHFLPGYIHLQPMPHPGHGHGPSHSKNPAIMKLHSSSSRSGSERGGGSGGKTPNPSSRALKHRPVALTHTGGSHSAAQQSHSISTSSGRRPKLIDVSSINLTPDHAAAYHHQYNFPPPNMHSHTHAHTYTRPRTHHMGPMVSLTLPSAMPPTSAGGGSIGAGSGPAPSSIPIQDNMMLPSTTKEQQVFAPRRVHQSHNHNHGHNLNHNSMPFRPSRPLTMPLQSSSGGSGSTNPQIQSQPSPIFFMSNKNGGGQPQTHPHTQPQQQMSQQHQRHFLFSHVPREFHEFHPHAPHQRTSRRTTNGGASSSSGTTGGSPPRDRESSSSNSNSHSHSQQ